MLRGLLTREVSYGWDPPAATSVAGPWRSFSECLFQAPRHYRQPTRLKLKPRVHRIPVNLKTVLKIGSVRWRGKCPRHPRFDPYLDGPGAVRGGCEKCSLLVEIQRRHVEMMALMRRFAPPQAQKRKADEAAALQQNLFGEQVN